MRYSEAKQGRVFVVRLEQGDVLHESIEELARIKQVRCAFVVALGGADTGSRLVVGPQQGTQRPVVPMEQVLSNIHEFTATGTVFQDEQGSPILHMHAANGRHDGTVTGCVRQGLKIWQVAEAIIVELLDSSAHRALDQGLGFKLLNP